MKGYLFQWRMAGRRKGACLLVLLFSAVVTVFLLVYPQTMDSTRLRLEEAYGNTVVKGWVLNGSDYADPQIPGTDWYTLVNSGYFSGYESYMDIQCKFFRKERFAKETGTFGDDREMLGQLDVLLSAGGWPDGWKLRAYNTMEACDDLMRMEDKIQWLDGYDPDCLEGEERICLLPEGFGYAPGDTVPILVGDGNEQREGIIRMKVAAVYPGSIPEFDCVIPLKTAEELCRVANDAYAQLDGNGGWRYVVNHLGFTVADNRKLPELKDFLDGLGYGAAPAEGKEKEKQALKISIDDRILQGTVAPIESNLALLENLYMFFFVMVTAIGFFISFLLARGRKPEYAVMRMLGESRGQITMKALAEQRVLCLCGVALGGLAAGVMEKVSLDLMVCAVILLCYTLGAAAVLLTVRVNVMDILRDKE